MTARPSPAPAVRVVRLSPFALEVIEASPAAPWDHARGVFHKRRDAEAYARAMGRTDEANMLEMMRDE